MDETIVGRYTSGSSDLDTSTSARVILAATSAYTIPQAGIISSFVIPQVVNLLRHDVMPVQFQVWRQLDNNVFMLVARTPYFNVTNQQVLRLDVPQAHPITVEQGDFIAFQIQGGYPVPFVEDRPCSNDKRVR